MKKLFISLILVLLLLSVVVVFFVFNKKETVKKEDYLKANLKVEEIDAIDYNIKKGFNNNASIIVENTSEFPGKYNLVWESIENTISDNENLTMEIDSSNNGGTGYNIVVPSIKGIILKDIKIDANTKQYYTFVFSYTGSNKGILKGKINVQKEV